MPLKAVDPAKSPAEIRVDERYVFSERIRSRIMFLRRHIDYIYDKTDVTAWLVRRGKGLPEVIRDGDD